MPEAQGRDQDRYLAAVPFTDNEHVKAGDVIARIDDPTLVSRSRTPRQYFFGETLREQARRHTRLGGSAAERPSTEIASKSVSALMAS